jgi:5-methylcytosine-specific restriction protein A
MSLFRPEHLCQVLTQKSGVNIAYKVTSSTEFAFYFSDLNEAETFFFDLKVEWKNFRINARPSAFSKPLLNAMRRAGPQRIETFNRIFQIISRNNSTKFSINGYVRNILDHEVWGADWNQFEWLIEPKLSIVTTLGPDKILDVLQDTLLICIGAIISLLPISAEGAYEGGLVSRNVEEYERRKSLRDDCLKFYGFSCLACGFDPASKYGPTGKQLIEVHHLERLADRGLSMTNPIADLVPLCANCHRIAHKRTPPFELDEIRDMIKAADELT